MTDPHSPNPYGPPPAGSAGPTQPSPQAPQIPYAAQNPYGAPAPYGYGAPQPRTNPLAIVSLIASGSIVVLFVFMLFLPAIGLLPGIAGVVTGHIALSQIKRTAERGRGLAIAGLVIGYATIGLLLLGFFATIALFGVMMAGGGFAL